MGFSKVTEILHNPSNEYDYLAWISAMNGCLIAFGKRGAFCIFKIAAKSQGITVKLILAST